MLAVSIWNFISPEQASVASWEGTLISTSQSVLLGGSYLPAAITVLLAAWTARP